ncbi:MAG TPA: YkvA family protein [Acidimicrobiia bacterium]|nr:YkvA family protein [Acidimicrobiia bacterium]
MTGQEPSKVRPDEVLPPNGMNVQARQLLMDAALMLPNLVKLVYRLLKDPRVPRRAKITLGLAAAYVASPIDLIPEVIPVLGWADDVLILLFAIDSLIDRAGDEVVVELWDGPGDLLVLIRDVVGLTRSMVPKRLTNIIDRLSG